MATFPAPFCDNMFTLRFYQTGTLTANFSDNQWPFTHPKDEALPVADRRQAWSRGVRVMVSSTAGDKCEYSFDGVNVHGYLDHGESDIYFERIEGGIAVRGVGTFWVEVW